VRVVQNVTARTTCLSPGALDAPLCSPSGSILWNVANLGYLTAWAGEQLATGKTFQPTNKVNDEMSAIKWDEASKTLVLGDPLLITTENVGQFNY